jgi:hypothetical protein
MSDIRYVYDDIDGGLTKPLKLFEVIPRIKADMKDRGPEWRWREVDKGQEWSVWRKDLDATLERMRSAIDTRGRVGDKFALDGIKGAFIARVRIIDISPPIKQTEGNDDIDEIYTWWTTNLKDSEWWNGGICNRRFISGTTTWTQHCPWPDPDPGSNAFDGFRPTMSQLYETADDIVSAAKHDDLPLGRIIVGQRQWTPSQEWHFYGGEFHRHGHQEGLRTRTGQPKGSC